MDNIITGIIAVVIFLAFVFGLAHSIGAIPFAIIVFVVAAMLCTDFYQSAKEGLQEERNKKSSASE